MNDIWNEDFCYERLGFGLALGGGAEGFSVGSSFEPKQSNNTHYSYYNTNYATRFIFIFCYNYLILNKITKSLTK